MKWLWIILALVYLLSPYDIIPGMSALGWLDDIFILILLFRYLSKFNRMRKPGNPPFEQRQQEAEPRQETGNGEKRVLRTPYEILEIPPTASQEEIKLAYRRLVNQYHPDKVSHLGEEFQKLAEQRFKEIQEAYQILTES